MSGKAVKIRLTTVMSELLQQLSGARSFGRDIATRAKIVLMGFQQYDNQTIAGELGTCSKTAGKRRRRDSYDALFSVQFSERKPRFNGRSSHACPMLRAAARRENLLPSKSRE